MSKSLVEVEGLKELRKSLRVAEDKIGKKALQQANKKIAVEAQSDARAQAQSGNRMQAKAASAIGASGAQTGASLVIKNTKRVPFAKGAFLGGYAKRWQNPWVGNSWEIPINGPYQVTESLRNNLDKYKQIYLTNVIESFEEAGLDVE